MKTLKVIGAGSIGNHLSHAARSLGWSVVLCDIDPAALERTRNEIYPGRYGKWDEDIRLCDAADAPKGGFDLIAVGTPPDTHVALAAEALNEAPRAILIEKPLCPPDLAGLEAFVAQLDATSTSAFVGYDHVVGRSAQLAARHMREAKLGEARTLDVEFREHWGGIFAAHPWLSGPEETYLGYWMRGGGASGEHSHALNLWQFFAGVLGQGRVAEVTAAMDFVRHGTAEYDRLCALTLRTETGFVGRVVQDVLTAPARKWARLQSEQGYVEWICGFDQRGDCVVVGDGAKETERAVIEKTRPDDFIMELQHIESVIEGAADTPSPISLEAGFETMRILAAAHRSAREGRTVPIDRTDQPTTVNVSTT